MRITHGMISDTTLRNLGVNLRRLEERSRHLTSGKRLSHPSDDPVDVAAALSHHSTLDQLDQHLKNIVEAKAWLETSDSALDTAGLPPTYQGDASLIEREMAPATNITVSVTGVPTFDPIFNALGALSTALAVNDGPALRASIGTISAVQSTLLTTRAQVGARVNRLEAQDDRLRTVQANVIDLLSKLEATELHRHDCQLLDRPKPVQGRAGGRPALVAAQPARLPPLTTCRELRSYDD